MKLIKAAALIAMPFVANAQTTADNTKLLVKNCLNMNKAFAQLSAHHTTSLPKTSFQYQNLEKGFKGVCSNAQFHLSSHGLKSTEENQQFIYLWSKDQRLDGQALNLDKINYTVKQPNNVSQWLRSKI